ncbi:hypothetical protein LBP_cg1685 [Lactiplantibacillus plantarum subsp. plantarum P-8]|nr:hypothetical protein LBP_cg1685 [Lactiplantibacillus plantarum subsp. plantarum P-8]
MSLKAGKLEELLNVYNDFGMDNYCLYCAGMYQHVCKK